MSSFTRFNKNVDIGFHPTASKILEKDYWVVVSGFSFELYNEGSNKWVHVPPGFVTDGASVPRLLWSLIPPWGDYGQAAILHDWLCDNMYYVDHNNNNTRVNLTRKQVDKIFSDALKVLGVNSITRKTLELGVNSYRKLCLPRPIEKILERKAMMHKTQEHFKQHGTYVF